MPKITLFLKLVRNVLWNREFAQVVTAGCCTHAELTRGHALATFTANVSINVYAKFSCAPLCTGKALGIFTELITTRTNSVAFWDPPSGSKEVGLPPT